jgi:hypothetical protein
MAQLDNMSRVREVAIQGALDIVRNADANEENKLAAVSFIASISFGNKLIDPVVFAPYFNHGLKLEADKPTFEGL